MPHVIVKLWPGKSRDQKQRLTETITRGVMEALEYGEDAVSVAFDEVAPAEWTFGVRARRRSKAGHFDQTARLRRAVPLSRRIDHDRLIGQHFPIQPERFSNVGQSSFQR